MTKEDIKALNHLAINEEVEGKFYHVHAEDGYMITTYSDGEDIKHYCASECMYMPIKEEYPDLRIITVQEHNRLSEACEVARQEEIEAKNNEHLNQNE